MDVEPHKFNEIHHHSLSVCHYRYRCGIGAHRAKLSAPEAPRLAGNSNKPPRDRYLLKRQVGKSYIFSLYSLDGKVLVILPYHFFPTLLRQVQGRFSGVIFYLNPPKNRTVFKRYHTIVYFGNNKILGEAKNNIYFPTDYDIFTSLHRRAQARYQECDEHSANKSAHFLVLLVAALFLLFNI